MSKKFLMIMAALMIAGSLGACGNTVHGAGEDIENMGQGIQREVPSKR